jgi:hypothetical protein
MEVSGQLHGPAALPPRKRPQYALDMRLSGPQSRPGQLYSKEKSLAFAKNRNLAVQPVVRRYIH